MIKNSDYEHLLDVLKEDIKIFREGIRKNSLSLSTDKSDVFNFGLFIELTKKYCFNNASKTIYRPSSIIPPDTESKMIPIDIIPVPEERLILFKQVVLNEFDENAEFTPSNLHIHHPNFCTVENLYYRFFYALGCETSWQSSNANLIFRELIEQWNRALKTNSISVTFLLPMDSISVIGEEPLKIEKFFKIKNECFQIRDKRENLIDWIIFNTFVIYRTNISVKSYPLNSNNNLNNNEEDYQKYGKEYQEKIKELRQFVISLYLNDFKFKWRTPILKLPWWFEPELFAFDNLQRRKRIEKFIERDANDEISSVFSNLNHSALIDKDGVIINSYYRFFQHDVINEYFIIDAFTFFEAMFAKGNNSYVSVRLGLNGGSIIANDLEEFWDIKKFMQIVYKIRSTVVHGSNWISKLKEFLSIESGNENDRNVVEFRNKLIKYMNYSLRYLIYRMLQNPDTLEEMSNDSLYFFNNSVITTNQNNRIKILGKIQQDYRKQKYKYENRWEEFESIFNLK